MGKHYSTEFKQKIIDEYKSGKSGGYKRVAQKYGLSDDTVYHGVVKDRKQGNQENIPYKRIGRTKEENIDYKERYEILKKYQAFLKAQREKK
jgi:transposase-like protein